MKSRTSLQQIQHRIIQCKLCPRLVRYLADLHKENPSWWCRPVPGFGVPNARILIVGLAPSRTGANRTGRMFTGDPSGRVLYRVLYRAGLASQPKVVGRVGEIHEFPLRLYSTYITAVIHCVPPGNKPLPSEIRNCACYLVEELKLLKNTRVAVALGRIAHDSYLAAQGLGRGTACRAPTFPFRHGAVYRLPRLRSILIDSYHPSPQNVNTGRLTQAMLLKVFKQAKRLARSKVPRQSRKILSVSCDSTIG